jgi:hypothetical protein
MAHREHDPVADQAPVVVRLRSMGRPVMNRDFLFNAWLWVCAVGAYAIIFFVGSHLFCQK